MEKAELYTRFSSPLIEPFKLLGSVLELGSDPRFIRDDKMQTTNLKTCLQLTKCLQHEGGLELILEPSYSGPGRQMNFQISTDFYN